MRFEPKDVVVKLEYDKVIDLLEKETLTDMAAEIARNLTPSTDFSTIDVSLRETRDFKLALEKNESLSHSGLPGCEARTEMLEIDGYTLQMESLQGILRILFTMRDIFKYFASGPKKDIYPELFDLIRPLLFRRGTHQGNSDCFRRQGGSQTRCFS
jgi:dsDNA-specific endonuclease/ATPase MutS2